MFDWNYKKRLKDDLEIWAAKGWITSEGAMAILQDQERDDGRSRLPMALAGIGMVCVALALFAFIAANWEAIPKTAKLIGIAVMIVGAHLLAAMAQSRGWKGIADLATGFATLVFVGGMALVGQIFHLPEDWAGGALLVCFGGLAAAWLTGSITSQVAAAVAAITWQVTRSDVGDTVLWSDLLGLGLLAAIFLHPFFYTSRVSRWAAISVLLVTYGRWFADTADSYSPNDDFMAAMALGGAAGLLLTMFQIGPVLDMFAKWSGYKPVRTHARWLMLRSLQDVAILMICAQIALILFVIPEASDRLDPAGLLPLPALMPLANAILLCVAGILMSFKTSKSMALFVVSGGALVTSLLPLMSTNVLLVAAASLATLIGFCALGTWFNNRYWMLCAYLALTAVALWLLQVTIGSLLGQSLFFLVAGVVLLAMALWLARLMRRNSGVASQEEAVS